MYSSQLEELKQELKVRLKQTALWDEVSRDRQIWVNLTTRADCKVVNTCNYVSRAITYNGSQVTTVLDKGDKSSISALQFCPFPSLLEESKEFNRTTFENSLGNKTATISG